MVAAFEEILFLVSQRIVKVMVKAGPLRDAFEGFFEHRCWDLSPEDHRLSRGMRVKTAGSVTIDILLFF